MNAKMLKKFLRDDCGATAVEFALVSVVFITLVFGIFATGWTFYTWNFFQYSLETATRYALVNPTATDDDLTSRVSSQLSAVGLDASKAQITVSRTTTSGVSFIEIDGVYPVVNILPLLPANWGQINLRAMSRIPTL